jgi:predicted type IV restriction endonuclease
MINLFIVLSLLNCSKPDAISLNSKSKGLILTQEEIKKLIPLLGSYKNSKRGFHIMYSEQFNDSTCSLRVYLDASLANEKLGVCDRFELSPNIRVFVYDSTRCNLDLPDSLTTSKANYLWKNDGLMWMVLAKRRGGNIEYYNIGFLNNPDDESLKDIDDSLFEN